MSSPISNYTEGVNFWEVNQQYKVKEPFKSLYKTDKSRGKKDSSITMWFVAFCYDRQSKYYKLPTDGDDGKHTLIGEDYCDNANFYSENKEVLDKCIEMYIKMEYTPMERHLKTWEDLLDKRTKFLQSQEYDLSTFDALDKMAVGTEKVHKTIKSVIDDLNKESSAGNSKGGSVASLGDSGSI